MLLNAGDEEINEEWEQLQVSIKGMLLCFQFFFVILIAKLIRNGNLGWQIHYIWPSLCHKFVLDSKEFVPQAILTPAFRPKMLSRISSTCTR